MNSLKLLQNSMGNVQFDTWFHCEMNGLNYASVWYPIMVTIYKFTLKL